MRQKPCRSQSARERRIELYVQARPSSSPSVTTVTVVTVATEERLNMSHRRRRRQQPQDWHQRRPQQQQHLHDWVTSTTTTNNNNTRSNNRACSEVQAGGLRARPTPPPSLPRDFFSPVVSIHPVWEHGTTQTPSTGLRHPSFNRCRI